MAPESTPKKEKKDKKRKSEAADTSIAPEPVAPEEGTASAEAVIMEVDGDRALKKQKKEKKEKRKSLAADGAEEAEDKKAEFTVPADAISPIAFPLAGKKLSKKLHKTVKKASKARQLKRGVKEVVKALRKGEKGLLLLASNITPIDVISHLPLLAEEAAGVEYCWVLSKEELGVYAGTKRATSCVLISTTPNKKAAVSDEDRAEVKAALEECMDEVKKLETVIKY
ncbi:H/ACA ribonucleoprotein complex subunit 2 [Cryptococcus bacillisporus CA1873]|uniref:H/ACA ribonucleoprotein complex subunit 2 n=1 Tax=Cryptococcus bacillisporus CA1873 TaxID=1296111 RepID=A0ABR5B9B4_CRYGA|nr:H/ACA ribonucleoprotein complex subunit 2 [Cryptococcus bacillisporus CA1873]|eukprot:KIR60108.1 H/ACA ribonucleoprotein complex subunit 2 [Cryptococcus gattii CA1873]